MSELTKYFALRAAEARKLSEAASDPRAVAAHANMAKQYEDLATDFNARRPSYHEDIPPEARTSSH